MMKCGQCGSENVSVVDTRSSGEWIRRRRACADCGKRWTTFEVPAGDIELMMKIRELVRETSGEYEKEGIKCGES